MSKSSRKNRRKRKEVFKPKPVALRHVTIHFRASENPRETVEEWAEQLTTFRESLLALLPGLSCEEPIHLILGTAAPPSPAPLGLWSEPSHDLPSLQHAFIKAWLHHCLSLSDPEQASPFLVEGLLSFLQEQSQGFDPKAPDVQLAHWLTTTPLPPLQDLWTQGTATSLVMRPRLARSFVVMILQQGSGETLQRWLQGSVTTELSDLAQQIRGKDLEFLEDEWHQFVHQEPPSHLTLGGVIRRTFRYWRPHGKLGALLLLMLFVQQLFHALFAFGLKAVVDSLQLGSALAFERVVGVLAIVFVAAAVASIYGEHLTARISTAILHNLRTKMFRALQQMSSDFYRRFKVSEVLARFTGDLDILKQTLSRRVVSSLTSGVGLLLHLPLLFYFEWRLALITLVSFPIVLGLSRWIVPRAAEARYRRRQREGELLFTVQENIQAHSVIQGYSLQDQNTVRFDSQLDEVSRQSTHADFLVGMVGVVAGMSVLFTQLVIALAGAHLALNSAVTAGTLVAFLSLLAKVSRDTFELAKNVMPDLIRASTGLQRIEEVFTQAPLIQEHPEPLSLPAFSKNICFNEVTFSYNGEQLTLQPIKLTLKKDSYIAMVGPSGAGKSSLLHLLLRFYDPSTGSIEMDGTDIRKASLSSLRRQIGMVFQENYLFSASLRDNIRIVQPDASDEDVEEAARAAEIHNFIQNLPRGYDTRVGEGSTTLSVGQIQRIAIARAMLRRPSILLLDEVTSSLDPETEAALYKTFKRLAQNRTIIHVTHRLAFARNADCIAVFHEGQLVEEGNHNQLLRNSELYAELWDKQTGFVVSHDGRHAEIEAKRLQRLPLFRNLNEKGWLNRMAQSFRSEFYDAGEVIAAQGQPNHKFYMIARGRVEVLQAGYVQHERKLNVLETGDYFGMLPLLLGQTLGTSFRAMDPCLLLVLPRDLFFSMIRRSPEVSQAVHKMKKQRYLEQLFGPRTPYPERPDTEQIISAHELLGLPEPEIPDLASPEEVKEDPDL